MPRTYKCKRCGIVHPPPTGKHCQRATTGEMEETPTDILTQVLGTLADMKIQMAEMDKRIGTGESDPAPTEAEDDDSELEELEQINVSDCATATGNEVATPDSLRRNLQLMAQAAGRIAQFRVEGYDDDDNVGLPRTKAQGRKAGALLVATDRIRNIIDWPHMHVGRMVNGKMKPLEYSELRVEEFVFGFLTMLNNPNTPWTASLCYRYCV